MGDVQFELSHVCDSKKAFKINVTKPNMVFEKEIEERMKELQGNNIDDLVSELSKMLLCILTCFELSKLLFRNYGLYFVIDRFDLFRLTGKEIDIRIAVQKDTLVFYEEENSRYLGKLMKAMTKIGEEAKTVYRMTINMRNETSVRQAVEKLVSGLLALIK